MILKKRFLNFIELNDNDLPSGKDIKDPDIVIADESQNFTFKELVTLITRIGENTKLFICGDTMQSDIGHKSGFSDMYSIFNDQESALK